MLAHYELYKSIVGLPGSVIECGVFKAASLLRFCNFREVLESPHSRKIVGFDTFGKFPDQDNALDQAFVRKFEAEASVGISVEELTEVLTYKKHVNVELVQGDICVTVPDYLDKHPELKISLLHIDVDVYKPSAVILKHLYERIVRGGVLVLDDYGTVEGETRAVDEFFAARSEVVEKLPISHIPAFVRKR